ncbi:Hypothetical predicted protein [Paramuricea clavata]|uniref:Reverse transcriptase/retrotransposon-derived protein RNase H-like domain-containing protein n=1 Tax=Paramuricea clavata TaxID=317549 RepID=A0A6S7HR66_PARCT|nr:Hypothetical predicted protein [Paramuricea clavata]
MYSNVQDRLASNSTKRRASSGLPNEVFAKLGSHTASLKEVVQDNVDHPWCLSHTRALDIIKCQISTETTLSYYHRSKAVVLQVDPSSKRLGAVLLQENKSIAFASKALTPSESRYANIGRELLEVFSPVELQQIREEAAKDGTLQILGEQVIQEWPGSIKKTQQAINSIQEGVE